MPFFERLVDAFYRGVAIDEVLLPLYPEAPDLTGARHRLDTVSRPVLGWSAHATTTSAGIRCCGCGTCRSGSVRRSAITGWPTCRAPSPTSAPTVPTATVADELMALLPARPPNTCATTPGCRSRRPRTATGRFAPAWPPSRFDGCARRTGRSSRSTTCRSTCRRARCTRCSDTTVPGSRRPSRSSKDTVTAPPATCRCSARTRGTAAASCVIVSGSCCSRRGSRPSSTSTRRSSCTGRATGVAATCDEVLELVGLTEQAGQRIGTLSGGQRRRIDLALGIVGHPELLFLDEPTTGFDPAARRRSWELISDLCGEGTTVLLTTHYLEEAEHLADRVGVLKAGRLIAEGAPSELIRAETETRVSFDLPDGITIDELTAVSRRGPSIAGRAGRVLDDDTDGRGRRAHRLGGGSRAGVGGAVGDATDTGGRLLGSRRRRSADGPTGHGAMSEWPSTVGLVVRQVRYQTPDVPARTDRVVLHAAVAADHAGAVQRPVRRRRGHGRRHDVADPPVLHGWPGGVHGRVGDVHQPREHGADPA